MDPTASWEELSRAIAGDNWPVASILADEILAWLRKGGFPPRISGVEQFDRIVARSMCESIAAWKCD